MTTRCLTKKTISRPEAPSDPDPNRVRVDVFDNSGNLLSRSKHYFVNNYKRSHLIHIGTDCSIIPRWHTGLETKTETFNVVNNAPVLVKTEETIWTHGPFGVTPGYGAYAWWNGNPDNIWLPDRPREQSSKVTLNDVNLVSQKTFAYDQYLNVTDTTQSAFGVGNPGPIIRRTHTDYLTTNPVNGSNYAAVGPNMLGLPSRRYVIDGPGTAFITRTDYEYDNHPSTETNNAPLRDRPNIVNLCIHYDQNITNPSCVTPSNSAYNTRGNLTSTTSYLDPYTPSGGITIYNRYDIAGNVVSTKDANGNVAQTDYLDSFSDGGNRYSYAYATSTISPIPAIGTSCVYDYSSGLVVSSKDANYQETFNSYTRPDGVVDPLNRIQKVTRPDGGWTSYEYGDTPGNIYVRTRTLWQSNPTQVVLDAFQYFDNLRRPTRAYVYDGSGSGQTWSVTDAQYDSQGRMWKASFPYFTDSLSPEIEPARAGATTEYDGLGRIRSVTTPEGAKVISAYKGNQVMTTDQAGKTRRSTSDALGRLTQVVEFTRTLVDPNVVEDPTTADYTTTYEYDELDNLRKITQGGQTRIYYFNSLSRLTAAVTPESGYITYKYFDGSNLEEKVDARGVKTKYTYDALNRIRTVNYENDPANTPGVNRTYDGAINGKGLIWKSETTGGTDTLVTLNSYDPMGRPLSQNQQFKTSGTFGQPYTVQRSYGLSGQLLTQTYPSGHVVTYNYDAAGRLQDYGGQPAFGGNLGDGVTRSYSSALSYDATGHMLEERYGTQTPLFHKMRFNERGQLYDVRLSTLSRSQSIGDWDRGSLAFYYGSDALGVSGITNNGNLSKSENYMPNGDGSFNQLQSYYAYDNLNRLTSVSEIQLTNGQLPGTSVFTQAYQYDLYGNRAIISGPEIPGINRKQFEVETASNRLYAPGDLALPVNQRQMKYDAAGNLDRDTYSGLGNRSYDADNRMLTATDNGTGWVSQYTYDADGRRVRRAVNNQPEVWQVYGMDGELLAEYTSGAAPFIAQKEYGYRGGQLLVTISNGDERRLTRFIQQLYRGSLGRDATQAEIQNWFNWLAVQGAVGQSALLSAAKMMAATLLDSPECFSRFRTDRQFVHDLYWTYFGRSASQSEEDYWAGRMAASGPPERVTRAQLRTICENWSEFTTIVAAVWGVNSTDSERTGHFLWNVYLGAFGVVPSQAQMQPQIADLDAASASGRVAVIQKAGDIARLMLTSQAYIDRNRSDEEFVADLYQALWQRNPDPDSWSYWTRQSQIRGRTWVLEHFLVMPAFHEVAGALYREVFWLVQDAIGTPRIVSERTGSLAGIKRHDYLPFGEEITSGIGGRTPQRGYLSDSIRQHFTSKERDDETGLDYFQARYYSSVQGRFSSPDEFNSGAVELFAITASSNPTFYADPTDPQTLNKYQYAHNNPLRYIDPSGHYPEDSFVSRMGRYFMGQVDPDSVQRENRPGPLGMSDDQLLYRAVQTGAQGFYQTMEVLESYGLDFGITDFSRQMAKTTQGNTDFIGATFASGMVIANIVTLGRGGAAKSIPRGFANADEFVSFSKSLNSGLKKAGFDDVQAIFQGSSVTGKNFKTGKAFDVGRLSDFDIALTGPSIFERAQSLGVPLRGGGTRTGPLSTAQARQLGLNGLGSELTLQAGRPVKFMIYNSPQTAFSRGASILTPR